MKQCYQKVVVYEGYSRQLLLGWGADARIRKADDAVRRKHQADELNESISKSTDDYNS